MNQPTQIGRDDSNSTTRERNFHFRLQQNHLNRLLDHQRALIPLQNRYNFLARLVEIFPLQSTKPAEAVQAFRSEVAKIKSEMELIEVRMVKVDIGRRDCEEKLKLVETEIDRLEREVSKEATCAHTRQNSPAATSSSNSHNKLTEAADDSVLDRLQFELSRPSSPTLANFDSPSALELLQQHETFLPILLSHLNRLSRVASQLWSLRSILQSRWSLIETLKAGNRAQREEVQREESDLRSKIFKLEDRVMDEIILLVVLSRGT